mgnify:FL=1
MPDRDIEYYKLALREIAYHGTSQPAALNMPEGDWYRGVAMTLIGIAARALNGTWDADDE